MHAEYHGFGNNKVLTVEAASLPVMRNFRQKKCHSDNSIILDAIAATLLTALALGFFSKQNPYIMIHALQQIHRNVLTHANSRNAVTSEMGKPSYIYCTCTYSESPARDETSLVPRPFLGEMAWQLTVLPAVVVH